MGAVRWRRAPLSPPPLTPRGADIYEDIPLKITIIALAIPNSRDLRHDCTYCFCQDGEAAGPVNPADQPSPQTATSVSPYTARQCKAGEVRGGAALWEARGEAARVTPVPCSPGGSAHHPPRGSDWQRQPSCLQVQS